MKYPFELMEDHRDLVRFHLRSEQVFRDLIATQKGEVTEKEFKPKYLTEAAILYLDMTGLTQTTITSGELYGLYRILNVQKVCGPIFVEHNARLIRVFADDFVALFDNPNTALDAAFEAQRRIRIFNQSKFAGNEPAQTCIGIGYAEVFTIGIDQAMGDEMNRASTLGKDVARGFEVLITERMYEAVKERDDCIFTRQIHKEIPHNFYKAVKIHKRFNVKIL
jgi:class 3 adenylate cyclase